jgi:hypothetical protein
MRNVFDGSINEKSTIEYPNFLISILKSPTPNWFIAFVGAEYRRKGIHFQPPIKEFPRSHEATTYKS